MPVRLTCERCEKPLKALFTSLYCDCAKRCPKCSSSDVEPFGESKIGVPKS